MMLALYSMVTWALQPFARRKAMHRRASEPVYGERIEERFGRYDAFTHDPSRPLIWMHAVSLGETRAAAILLKELRLAIPNMRLLLTNGTATGREEGVKLLQAGDVQVWQPWDTRTVTQSFFTHFKPNLGVLMETEIWPNLIASSKAAGVPVVLANARMSEKSYKKTLKFKWLASQAYRGLAQVYAQTQDDAKRLVLLDAKVDGVLGNLKFDVTPNAEQLANAAALRAGLLKPVILFASSREGEELAFLNALQALPDVARTSAHWLIVPRHPQRFDEVASLIDAAGFMVLRRSTSSDFDTSHPIAIWLGDSLGEMTFYSGLASVAFLGGSFEKLGGQNLIELLACGCPVVMGRHTFNFLEAATLAVASGVAFEVDGFASAIQQGLALCAQYKDLSNKAITFVSLHRGAAIRTADAIQKMLTQLLGQ